MSHDDRDDEAPLPVADDDSDEDEEDEADDEQEVPQADDGALLGDRARRLGKYAAYIVGGVVGLVALFAAFIGTIMVAGPIAAVVYWMLFWVGLLWIPFTIFMFSPMFPTGARSLFGIAHVFLMQIAHGGTAFVQDGDEYHAAPLDDDAERYWYDGEWHDVVDPENNVSILAWQPFTTVFHKREDSFERSRVDPETVADGGVETRGGYEGHVSLSSSDDDSDEEEEAWTLDIAKHVTGGLLKLGDVDILEKTEEITERKQTDDSRLGGWEPLIATFFGLLLGVATGYVSIGGF